MINRFDNVLLYERWRDQLTLDEIFLICKNNKNTHIIIDNCKENTISTLNPGQKIEDLIPGVRDCKEWNAVNGNKLTLVIGNYKPWHQEVAKSTINWTSAQNFDHTRYSVHVDDYGHTVLQNLWDDIQIWPTYFLAWNGYKIFKNCNYNTKLGDAVPYPNIEKLFCLKINSAKPHRVLLLDELEKRNLLEDNIFSCLGPQDYLDESLEIINAQHYRRGIQTLGQPVETMNPYAAQPPKYDETLIEVVSETYIGSHFYTEKTLWPIVYRKPFLIHGAQYQNYDLQKLGFQLYDEYIDYSFDKILDHRERTAAVAQELHRLNNLSLSFQEVYEMLLPKISHNLKVMLEMYHRDPYVPAVIREYGPHIWQGEILKHNVHHTEIIDPENATSWLAYVERDGCNQKAVEHIRSQPYLFDVHYRKN